MDLRVTVCVLLYGNYPELARQVIHSIVSNCDKRSYKLIVGCNACCRETLDFINSVEQIDETIISEENLNKCPMQRQMFKLVDTEFVWWFDDDSQIIENDALDRRLALADAAPQTTVLWGPLFYWNDQGQFNFGIDVSPWIRSQAWYSREPIPCDPSGKWVFIIGGCWFARTSILQHLNWPPESFVKPGDDAIFCEAMRQSGHAFESIGECGVQFQSHERRAPETLEMMLAQVATTGCRASTHSRRSDSDLS